ncbi:hypothetical protein ACHHYP_20666 [Achlya hypogyna]|uniref:Uncharacterized protein n=1 Tax=Achlya hypogyna TaxID=1202772 RepID=A0A1V9YFT4_ACHHY|nr:hypothetical protein ACHHYP_20666 [Achlya hypogyna]
MASSVHEALQASGEEVEIVRAVIRWGEQKATSTYSSANDLPVVGHLLSATESVAKRVNADRWFGSLYEYVDPVATKIDHTLSRHVLNSLGLRVQTADAPKSRSIHITKAQPPQPVADAAATDKPAKDETKELQIELETLRTVLRMIRQENQSLRSLETELEVLRSTLKRFHDENEELLQSNTAASIKVRHLESEISALHATIAAVRAEAATMRDEACSVEARSKTLEAELDGLRGALTDLELKNAKLQQELIDVHTYRDSAAGQTMSELEELLAASNVQNALLEAENKKLRVSLQKTRSGAQKQKGLARTQSMNLTGL